MKMRKPNRMAPVLDRSGFSLLEVLVAAFLLIIVFFGLAQVYNRGRVQVDFEEHRRKATAVAQARLDGIRRDFSYDQLPGLANTDTVYNVDNLAFTVHHEITPAVPEPRATTIRLTVTWTVSINGNPLDRSVEATTILGRGMEWQP